MKQRFIRAAFFCVLVSVNALLVSSCASQRQALQAEEFFAIGMAFFELGRFSDAEIWLNRARTANRTMTASEYNLGRIAFETGRFEAAALHFEGILRQDPQNIMALRGAAYSRIRNGDLEMAEALYERVLALVPESADGAFNYALVLYAMGRYEDSEAALLRYPHAMEGNTAALLLFARTQNALNNVEALDSFDRWLAAETGTPNPLGLYEYAQLLETSGFFARAIEQFDAALEALTEDTAALSRSSVLFGKARLLLAVDPENAEGSETLNAAAAAGFSDTEALEALLADERITSAAREEIRGIIEEIQAKTSDSE